MTSLIEKLDKNIPCLGILFILVSSFFATGGKLFVKQVNDDLHSVVIVMVRCGLLSIVWLFVCAIRRDFIFGQNKSELRLLFLRGLLGFTSFMLSYYSLAFIPLADACTIILSTPIYTSVFGYFFLKEKCGPINIALIFVALSGVFLICRPSFIFSSNIYEEDESDKIIGTTLAFLSSVIAALANIVMRKLKNVPAPVVVTWFSICSFLFALIGIILAKIILPEEHTITIRVIDFEYEFLILLLNSACGIFAQLFITLALKVEEAGTISLARSVDIVLSFIFQAVFLKNEPIYWTSIFGAIIIGVAVTLSALRIFMMKRKVNKTNKDTEVCEKNKPSSSKFSMDNQAFDSSDETIKSGQYLTVNK